VEEGSMSESVYKWKGFVSFGVPAQVAGEELERIRVKYNGRLISANIINEAKETSSPLHKIFEWDNAKAAHMWRLNQAGDIIRNIVVVNVGEDGEKKTIRAFVNVTQDEDRHYTSISHAMSDDVLRKQVIAQAWDELTSWKERYKELVEFSKVFAVIDATVQKKAA
jgi:hypothetical protein